MSIFEDFKEVARFFRPLRGYFIAVLATRFRPLQGVRTYRAASARGDFARRAGKDLPPPSGGFATISFTYAKVCFAASATYLFRAFSAGYCCAKRNGLLPFLFNAKKKR